MDSSGFDRLNFKTYKSFKSFKHFFKKNALPLSSSRAWLTRVNYVLRSEIDLRG